MPFFNWALLKSRTLHPDIGIPADDSQGLPYLNHFSMIPTQNYGLAVKEQSGADSITGYLFTANRRYLLGSGEAKALNITNNYSTSMFAIDSLSGHVFATTASGIINSPISITGDRLGWSGGQWDVILDGGSSITFFNYSGSNFVGFGSGGNFSIFKPGGIVNAYYDYNSYCKQPCAFYNGLYTIVQSNCSGAQYGFLSTADAPDIIPAFYPSFYFSYSFNESTIILSEAGDRNEVYGYDGMNDPTLASSFIKTSLPIDTDQNFGFDPVGGRLLSLSLNTVTVGGHTYYPIYVYNNIFIPSTPQQYARPVKNYTVNGHLNWRKR